MMFAVCAGWVCAGALEQEDKVRQAEASTDAAGETVLLGGTPVGIYMETDGVMVLSTESMKGVDGEEYEPAAGLVQSGDYIMAVNGEAVTGKAELLDAVEHLDSGNVVLTIQRGEETMDIRIRPVECGPDEYKLGIWVRDNVQGLGTITFVTGQSRFGALGHGIHDVDTNVLMSVDSGTLYKTSIQDILKGEDGNPGTMEGIIVYNNYNILGSIDKNTEAGIYGTVDRIDELFDEQIPIETASTDEIETGSATIRCFVDNELKEYEIQVTDPELLEKTGGIIQGMSGSPIIQNGKLIGAVTHVFVQDSTKGYGIFIENMLNQVK